MAYAALAAVVALIVGGGLLAQPVYGSESPFGGTTFAEVRALPTTSGWSLSLGREFGQPAGARCLAFRSGTVDARHELVTAETRSADTSGQEAACPVPDPQAVGRLVMVDPATGVMRWSRDLGELLDEKVFSLVWHSSDSAGVVVVGVDGSRGDDLVALDSSTGRIISRGAVSTPDAAINFAVAGHLVVSVVPDVGGAVDAYSLRRTDALGTMLWARSISSVLLPQLLPDRFVVPLPEGTVAVDGLTGVEHPWRTDLRSLEGVRVSGERVVAQTIPRGVGLSPSVVMLDASGRVLWSRVTPSITGLQVARRCVVVSTGASRVTCLDPASGAVRWSTAVPGSAVGTPSGARTGDVVSIGPVHARDTTLDVSELDGDTGRVRFATALPRGTEIVGQASATGYALGTTSSARETTLSAFDLASGATLWTLRAPDLDVWGGELVEIGGDGVVRQLVDGHRPSGHGMLVG